MPSPVFQGKTPQQDSGHSRIPRFGWQRAKRFQATRGHEVGEAVRDGPDGGGVGVVAAKGANLSDEVEVSRLGRRRQFGVGEDRKSVV